MAATNLDYADRLNKSESICLELDKDVIAEVQKLSETHNVSIDAIINGLLYLVVSQDEDSKL